MLIYLQMIETEEQRDAFTAVYEQYYKLLFKVAYDKLSNVSDAEDAVHLAFLALANNMAMIDQPISAKTKSLLITIVEAKSIDIIRKEQYQRQISQFLDTEKSDIDYTGSVALAACLAKLPPRYQQLITLKYYQGLDNKQIAKIFGVKESSVRKMLQYTREKLQKLCEEEELM